MKKVILTFDESDNPTIEVNGCTGTECAMLTKAVEEALGTVKIDSKKKEFFQNAKQGEKVQGKT